MKVGYSPFSISPYSLPTLSLFHTIQEAEKWGYRETREREGRKKS